MENFQFANSEYLFGLISIPCFILIFIFLTIKKNKDIKTIGDDAVIKSLMPEFSKLRPIIKFSILMLSLTFIILAIARPQVGSKLKEIKTKGAEIIIALDVSNSMLAQDISPNRLEKAKASIVKLMDKLYTDKLGIIIFAGEASTQVPMTNDYTSSKLFVKSIQTNFIDVQGTAIGAAINLAMNSFSPNDNNKNKAIIVISDGENHEDDAITAAKNAQKNGVIVYAIGIGSDKGEPIPDGESNKFKKDKDGNLIMTKLNEEMLKQIAKAGDGIYVKANNSSTGLEYIYDEIEKVEKGEVSAFSEYNDKFQYLIFAAFVLLIFEFFVLERKNRWLSKIKIFE